MGLEGMAGAIGVVGAKVVMSAYGDVPRMEERMVHVSSTWTEWVSFTPASSCCGTRAAFNRMTSQLTSNGLKSRRCL